MVTHQLIVLLKAPRPGAVKTRLAQTLGAEAACAAYRQLVGQLLKRIGGIDHVQLRFAPDDAGEEIRPWLRPGWSAAGQGGGDLGERLARTFQDAFAAGARRVVVIGGDCPEIAAQDIEAAWAALARCDLVLGPAADGGYWLVGLRVMERPLFSGIAWSTGDVLQQTLDCARAAGRTVELLRELHDVDTEADWRRFLERAK
jgi:hypothetical protein